MLLDAGGEVAFETGYGGSDELDAPGRRRARLNPCPTPSPWRSPRGCSRRSTRAGSPCSPPTSPCWSLGDDSPGPARAVGRALGLTAWMTVGFVAVFGIFGLVISPLASEVQRYLPWFTTAFGVLVAAAGALAARRA